MIWNAIEWLLKISLLTVVVVSIGIPFIINVATIVLVPIIIIMIIIIMIFKALFKR